MVVLFLGSGLNLHVPVSPRNGLEDRKLADTSLGSRVCVCVGGVGGKGSGQRYQAAWKPSQEVGLLLSQKGQHNLWLCLMDFPPLGFHQSLQLCPLASAL